MTLGKAHIDPVAPRERVTRGLNRRFRNDVTAFRGLVQKVPREPVEQRCVSFLSVAKRSFKLRGPDRDVGMAMLAVLMCVIVVVGLTTAAVQQTVGSLSETAQGRNLIQTADAADAGIQAELAILRNLTTATAGTQVPCANSQVTVASAVDAAGVASYTLSMSDPGAQTSAIPANLISCSSSHTFSVPSGLDPWYVLVQSSGSTVGSQSSGLSGGRTLQALASVNDSNSTVTVTTTTVPTTTTTTVAPSTYSSNASAQAINLALLGSTVALGISSPPTSATNNGSGSNSAVTVQPTVSIPGADNFLSATLASQVAEANTDGSSYGCAGLLAGGGTLTGGSSSGPCTPSAASTGVSLNLLGLPGLATPLGAVVGGLTLKFDGVSSWATDNSGGTSPSGEASFVSASVTVTLLGGLLSATLPLNLPGVMTTPTNLLPAIVTAITGAGGLIGAVAGNVSSALLPVLSLTGDYQSSSGGVFTESGVHIAIIGTLATADLAKVTVGPNTTNTPTTTLPPSSTTTSTTSTTVALPANGVTVEYIKQAN